MDDEDVDDVDDDDGWTGVRGQENGWMGGWMLTENMLCSLGAFILKVGSSVVSFCCLEVAGGVSPPPSPGTPPPIENNGDEMTYSKTSCS